MTGVILATLLALAAGAFVAVAGVLAYVSAGRRHGDRYLSIPSIVGLVFLAVIATTCSVLIQS